MVLRDEGDPAGGHGREMNCKRSENEKLVQIYFINLDQDFGESDAVWCIPNKFKQSIIWDSFPVVIQSLVHKEQLH